MEGSAALLMVLAALMTFFEGVTSATPSDADPNGGSKRHNIVSDLYTGESDVNLEDVANIIDSLENMAVLDSRKLNCYTLDRITKTQEKEGDVWKVGVFLYVRELGIRRPEIENSGETSVTHAADSTSSNDNSSGECIGGSEGGVGFLGLDTENGGGTGNSSKGDDVANNSSVILGSDVREEQSATSFEGRMNNTKKNNIS